MNFNQPTHPGYEQFTQELSSLISLYPPPFIYVNDVQSYRTTTSVIDDILEDLSERPPSLESPTKIYHARIDGVASSQWGLDREGDDGTRWNENLDSFLHGLRALHTQLCKLGVEVAAEGTESYEGICFVIVVKQAEILKDALLELMAPLPCLGEMAQLIICVVFISQVRRKDIKPPLGAAPEPYFMDIGSPTKEHIVKHLLSQFSTLSTTDASSSSQSITPYHPSLLPLYRHFTSVLCDVCFPFTHDPQDLAYIAVASWPGYAKPVLDEHRRYLAAKANEMDLDVDGELEDGEEEQERRRQDALALKPPGEDTRMRLTRLFNPSLSAALEVLLPRLSNAAEWAALNEPPPDLLAMPHGPPLRPVIPAAAAPSDITTGTANAPVGTNSALMTMGTLPRMARFLLVAAFLASMNPAKSDLRMFGRGLDEKKRKQRRQVARIKSKAAAKIPQRLLGPAPFPLDRLLAILGALLEENDAETRLPAPEFTIPGEYTDMEIARVGVLGLINQLTSMRLLFRTSPVDRLDGPPMYKCSVGYDSVLGLARGLKIPLNDLLWDPV
ncbi:origin recognition complex subunit 5 C-terminus-domain-containing protein [Crucibulum laeve]|uniref:Origin recognition complex subunit 5 C-terminus-domain-containing protein n=1 Tax=Crucibulum laeve TaxID=68775 RepID=A0A5C3LTX2_9AGAR|nr:origin recognition complex subunit 5 C-terminus-domain-containing protein [Crucibulum laeve]